MNIELNSLRERIEKLTFNFYGLEVPRILLGTSPFIGAGQFGGKSIIYYRRFYMKPENIVNLVCFCMELGVLGIQLLPYSRLVKAVKKAEEIVGKELTVIAVIGPDNPKEDIEKFSGLKIAAILLHAGLTDIRNQKLISSLMKEIEKEDYIPGLATHKPYSTLIWLEELSLKPVSYTHLTLPTTERG